ncbi:MAG: pyridoxal-5'-phosphate-dependent protein [Rhodospirillaceae bacterium]|jgi:threonine dehydratase|nr:pyridoxal-5'-phosphate-dependent protein [Rhodospirillaceae bacterium]|tara:strand:+ start:1575 stop:2576 length:1002 start_codon:yes stop_codon:yes gene_type:complete
MPTSPAPEAPAYDDVVAAAEQIAGHAVTTPLLESPLLNEKLGGRLLVKAECLQRSGAFKFRGAYNRISRLGDEQRRAGVVAFSSGNHAQGVAMVAQMLGVPAVIVMPTDAPEIKLANTRAYGAEVVMYDRETESREEIGERLAAERKATLVPSYDDPLIIAGQGTVGLEIAAQAREMDARLDAVIAPCGGGGLISGCALALSEECPEARLFTAEPEGFDDTARSLAAGERVSNDKGAKTFCDALILPTPGVLTFSINQRLLAGGFALGDAETAGAMKAAFQYLKLVVEPGGAVALAAALTGAYDCKGKTVAVVCSGGNVDPGVFAAALGADKD